MAGEDREFLDFFADEFWSLRRVGFLLTGDWGEAEELAQEARARAGRRHPLVAILALAAAAVLAGAQSMVAVADGRGRRAGAPAGDTRPCCGR